MNKTDNQEKNIQSTELGKLGEKIAKEFLQNKKLLQKKEYENVTNLNDLCQNFPYADIYAEKEGGKFIISVKTRRRKTSDNRPENKLYNLSYKTNPKMINFAKKNLNLNPYWIAVTVEVNELEKWVYSIYFGSLEDLNGRKTIPMQECRKGKIGECWIKEGTPLPKKWVKKLNEIKY